jgi:hypothetical protein
MQLIPILERFEFLIFSKKNESRITISNVCENTNC